MGSCLQMASPPMSRASSSDFTPPSCRYVLSRRGSRVLRPPYEGCWHLRPFAVDRQSWGVNLALFETLRFGCSLHAPAAVRHGSRVRVSEQEMTSKHHHPSLQNDEPWN